MARPTIAITGATGFLGSLIAARWLAHEPHRLVLLVRPQHSVDAIHARLRAELDADGVAPFDLADRLVLVPLPEDNRVASILPDLRRLNIEAIIHAAGCVDYFHSENLTRGNVDLTRDIVTLAQELKVQRFGFVSTAFSGGYRDGLIPETLHDETGDDPTEYTRSKRAAEFLVARSGLPYLITRPSVVIGDSRDGRYGGKRYGVYQLWYAADRLLCANYVPIFHAIAPRLSMPLLHQNAFQSGFHAAWQHLPDNKIIHLVSKEETLPTVRDIWDMWLMHCARPREIHYYQRLADVPMEKLSRSLQMWVEITSTNLDISTWPWHFDDTTLSSLRAKGLEFPSVTPASIAICQEHFIQHAPRVRQFMEKFLVERAVQPRIFEPATLAPLADDHGDHRADRPAISLSRRVV